MVDKEILEDPYKYICDWAESLFKNTGGRIFKYTSLMPISLVAPDILYRGKQIRSNINVLLLSPSGTGKTSIGKIISNFSQNPINFENITPARLSARLMTMRDTRVTLVSTDIAKTVRDLELVKLLEQVLGEERQVMRDNMKSSFDFSVNATTFLAGVPSDLLGVLSSGLLFRCASLVFFHTAEEHKEIGQHITEGIGDEGKQDGFENKIKEFYESIRDRQDLESKNKIEGFIYSDEIKDKIFETWNNMTNGVVREYQVVEWHRELYSGYRYLNAYCLMNLHNREPKMENQKLKLVATEEDLKIALKLMKRDISSKIHLLNCKSIANKIRTMKELQEVMKTDNVDEESKQIIKNLKKDLKP